ncbi:LysR family transcriptional regulator [Paludibacterium yongneupense]|uniref:LysR family transcriptional regulator n=1 Tax=Paludibacterium yongneupense TaxID=400061 RepID=UPI00042A26BA|nr:LysR family transcriptional regulator [Paludibacterium yongneupense]
MDKLQAMEVFVRVVETGGITSAAASLRLPKSTATTLIQKLEVTLGVKLLNRTTRRVSVTPDGAAYYTRCLAILAEVRDTEDSIAQHHARPGGRLRIDVPTLMARSVIVPALPVFFERYPEIKLELGCSERRAELIEEGIDCAVWSGELQNSSLVARRVGQLFFATCASPAYLAAHGQPLHPADLAAHRCINHFSPRSGKIADWIFAKDGERIQAPLDGHIALDDENSYVAAAEAGLGIAKIPAFVLKDAMEHGRLELVLGDWLPEPVPLYIVYPQNRHLSAKVRVFVDWIAELFQEHDAIQLRSTLHPPSLAAARRRV